MSPNRLAATALAAFAAVSAIPIPLAQLDFAGLFDVFDIHAGDTPAPLLVVAGIGGVLTICVVALAFAGAALALVGARSARMALAAAALAGLVTAFLLWIPVAVLLGAAAALTGRRIGDRSAGAAA